MLAFALALGLITPVSTSWAVVHERLEPWFNIPTGQVGPLLQRLQTPFTQPVAHPRQLPQLGPGQRLECRVVQETLQFRPQDRQLLQSIVRNRPDLIGWDLPGWIERQVGFPISGVQQQLYPGAPLTTAISQRTALLPLTVNPQLGLPADPNIRVGIIGNDAILLDLQNQRILDVMLNVI
jgi:hypothetical protein